MSDLNIVDVSWHDGVLRFVQLVPSDATNIQSSVNIKIDAYLATTDTSRTPLRIECKGVARSVLSINFAELLDNRNAGNVSNVYLKKANVDHGNDLFTIWIYLADGIIEVVAESILCKSEP